MRDDWKFTAERTPVEEEAIADNTEPLASSGSAEAHLALHNDKRRRAWAKRASGYDKSIGFFERRIFGTDHRAWACSKAKGKTLEVAVGTGLNLPLYEAGVGLTGIDLSPQMLAIARQRSVELKRTVDLQEADAHSLPFEDGSFDTAVCTYSLCNIPDAQLALSEMRRVLRNGGKLVLVDHIRSESTPVLWFQRFIEFFSRRIEGEHMTRRPAIYLEPLGFEIEERERCGFTGVVERVVARKPE